MTIPVFKSNRYVSISNVGDSSLQYRKSYEITDKSYYFIQHNATSNISDKTTTPLANW